MSTKNIVLPGVPVIKTNQALPATATATLYTITGGDIMITGLFARVTTALGATATNLSLGTGLGGTAALATATAIASHAAGAWFAMSQTGGNPAALLTPAGPLLFGPLNDLWASMAGCLVAGPDTITWTTSATDTGALTWYLYYVPLTTGAAVS